MKKILLILLIFITGCSYQELNDLSVIKNIGIKYENKQYTLTAAIVEEIDKNNQPSMKIIEVNEKTIDKAFEQLLILSNKTIHYAHIDLLILDPNIDNNNLKDIFTYFINNNEFRNDFSVIVSNNIDNLIEESNYDEIEQLLMNNQHPQIINIDIETIIKEFLLNNKFTLSVFDYNNDNIEYQKNITLPLKENYEQ